MRYDVISVTQGLRALGRSSSRTGRRQRSRLLAIQPKRGDQECHCRDRGAADGRELHGQTFRRSRRRGAIPAIGMVDDAGRDRESKRGIVNGLS
jgi:hypothetical protein